MIITSEDGKKNCVWGNFMYFLFDKNTKNPSIFLNIFLTLYRFLHFCLELTNPSSHLRKAQGERS
jgi:hypothetical protein